MILQDETSRKAIIKVVKAKPSLEEKVRLLADRLALKGGELNVKRNAAGVLSGAF